MKNRWKAAIMCCGVAATAGFGEILKAESNTFTFPEITAISAKKITPQQSWFKHTGLRPMSRSITFSWAFPGSFKEKSGVIIVYSLLGKAVAEIPIYKNTGTATWRFSAGQSGNGLFIARITFGGQSRNLKLMLWN